jgi:hypothetical protein
MSTDTNIENKQAQPAPAADASEKLNQDLYRWSPEGPAGQGACQSKQSACGDGAQTGRGNGGSGQRSSDCDWRPDPTLSTPRARAWQAESQRRRNLPMEVNADCTYTVKFGDSLWTIAERELRREGINNPSEKAIRAEIKAFVDANDQKYRSLDCNDDLIKVGWKLNIPKCAEPPVVEKPCPPPVQERPCPPPVQERPCPPPVQERPCPPPVQEVPPPPPQVIRPPEWFRPEPPRDCPPVYEQPCPPQIICRPAQMQIIRIPEPVCYPVQIRSDCCCCCRPCEPMYERPRVYAPQPPRYYYEEPRYYEPQPQYYQPSMPDATYRRMPEAGYRPRPYANYPFEPLVPDNDWIHRRR